MMEVLTEAIAPLNLPFTVLLAIVMLYWLLVALGALDSDAGGDLHAGAEAHLDTEMEADGDLHSEGGTGLLAGTLHFINLGDAPLMVVLSILSLSLWTCSLLVNHYFTHHEALLAVAFLLPELLLSALVTRYVTLPLKPLFRMLQSGEEEAIPLVGRSCRIITTTANEAFGQAEIQTDGAPLLINVRTLEGVTLPRGATALVFREDVERGVYFVSEISDAQL